MSPIAGRDARSAHPHLTVDDANLHVADRTPHAARTVVIGMIGQRRQALGHAEAFDQRVAERVGVILLQGNRDSVASANGRATRGDVSRTRSLLSEESPDHRRQPHVEGRTAALPVLSTVAGSNTGTMVTVAPCHNDDMSSMMDPVA